MIKVTKSAITGLRKMIEAERWDEQRGVLRFIDDETNEVHKASFRVHDDMDTCGVTLWRDFEFGKMKIEKSVNIALLRKDAEDRELAAALLLGWCAGEE